MTNVINFRMTKVGGIWFFRLGDFQISFCVTSNPF